MPLNEQPFQLKLATGKVVTWNGTSGPDAAVRYVDCFRGAEVVAWRAITTNILVHVNPASMRDG